VIAAHGEKCEDNPNETSGFHVFGQGSTDGSEGSASKEAKTAKPFLNEARGCDAVAVLGKRRKLSQPRSGCPGLNRRTASDGSNLVKVVFLLSAMLRDPQGLTLCQAALAWEVT
jgi:hypothetical protein